MRLIDADELIKEFDPDGENLSPITVRLKIARQQTAYDVDKVVEELKKKALESAECKAEAEAEMCGSSASRYGGELYAYNKAVEIVKGGGVNAT